MMHGFEQLTPDEFHELAFLVSQLSPDGIQNFYQTLDLPEAEKSRGAAAMIAARRKLLDYWKSTPRPEPN